jgi:hypothetical protein
MKLRSALLSLGLVCAWIAHAHAQVPEVNLKSAFLYKFIHYAEWPHDALGAPGEPIVICVIAQEELAQVLEGAVSGRTSHERPVAVRRIAQASEAAAGCHVLFLGSPDPEQMREVIAGASATPTLTVGDAEGFAQRGA